jgi:GT2 family glycosyltransferase
MDARVRVSVIVLAWNGVAYLDDCLNAVLGQQGPDFELVVVDNASTDGSADLVAERFAAARLIRNRRNLGFAGGCNVGLRAATGDVLVLLNQDTVVHDGWLAALTAAFDEPTVGIAGCKALYPNGSIQHAGGLVHGARAETEHVGRGEPDDGRFDALSEPHFVTGAALAISRTALARIGLLDEGFFPAYYEDVDWCTTAREAGFRVVVVPEARLVHLETPTAQRESYEHKAALHRGRLRFVFKHWPLARLAEEFIHAEREWAAVLGRTVEMMAARRAYLTTLLDVGGIAAFRTRADGVAEGADPEEEALALLRLLTDLRAACVEGRGADGALFADRYALFRELWERHASWDPPPFVARVPILGPRLAAAWQLCQALRHQVAFYRRAGEMLNLMVLWNEELARDVAESLREIDALAERLAVARAMGSEERNEGC